MVSTNTPAAPTAEFIEAFNAQLREAKAEALSVIVTILRLDTDKDLAIRTQQRLAATAILRVKELKPPKPPREPRTSRPLSHFMGEDRPRRQPRSGEGGLRASSPMPRSLKSLAPAALIALAERAFAPDSGFRAMDQLRLARHVALEHASQQRAEMSAQRAQARAMRRKPET